MIATPVGIVSAISLPVLLGIAMQTTRSYLRFRRHAATWRLLPASGQKWRPADGGATILITFAGSGMVHLVCKGAGITHWVESLERWQNRVIDQKLYLARRG